MIPENIYLKILLSAVKAPSAHNTQPWLFVKEEDRICIIPDFNRSLPVADPDHRELFISLGCAAETAMIAARFYGYQPSLQIDASNTDCSIIITLKRDDSIVQPELFSYINARQTTRNLYETKSIPGPDLETLKTTVSEAGLNILFYKGQKEIQYFSHFIAEANSIQMGNTEFKNELIQWLRFSEKEAMQKGDGLYAACNGMPSLGRAAGSFLLKNLLTAKGEEKRLLKQVHKTDLVAMFTSQDNAYVDWVKIGMIFQRFALTATKLGLSQSFINLPCQIPQVRDKMMRDLSLHGFPQLLIRLGYSPKMHFSFRRRITDVILK